LGNVLAVVSDELQPSSGGVEEAVVVSATDYYAFGQEMPGRTFASEDYRYGYSGMESEKDISDGFLVFGDYGYDSRIGRRWCVDPLIYKSPANTPYGYALNNPIILVDPEGEFPFLPILVKVGGAVAVDIMLQVGMAYLTDKDVKTVGQAFQKVDWIGVAWSGAQALNPFKIPGGKLGNAVAGAAAETAATALREAYAGRDYSATDALQDFFINTFASLGSDAAGDLLENPTVRAKMNTLFGGTGAMKKLESKCEACKNLLRTGCFAEGTLVATNNGLKTIETIAVGDSVWAYSDILHRIDKQVVLRTPIREVNKQVHLTVGTTDIYTTPEHPFYTNKKWIDAANLHIGDSILLFDKTYKCVTHFSQKDTVWTVYNLTVDNYHTYFVSESKVLVHNNNHCGIVDVVMGTDVRNISQSIKAKIEATGEGIYTHHFKNRKTGEIIAYTGQGAANDGVLARAKRSLREIEGGKLETRRKNIGDGGDFDYIGTDFQVYDPNVATKGNTLNKVEIDTMRKTDNSGKNISHGKGSTNINQRSPGKSKSKGGY
jgi:RHS repeat-associated protein